MQIEYLQDQIPPELDGNIFFEFVIPRMGKRADCIILTEQSMLVIEFKVNATTFDSALTGGQREPITLEITLALKS